MRYRGSYLINNNKVNGNPEERKENFFLQKTYTVYQFKTVSVKLLALTAINCLLPPHNSQKPSP